MSGGDYIAIDWGTTNRRVYLMRGDGSVVSSDRDDRGVMRLACADFSLEVEDIRGRLGDLPVLAAGMVGSSRGWREVPYCAAPASIEDLAAATATLGNRIHIVPGISVSDVSGDDVMRGEEVQVFGALRTDKGNSCTLFCQPGTHNKWVATEDQKIVSVATSMTGEIFSLLKNNSVLSGLLDGGVAAGDAFNDGLKRGAGSSDLLTALFRARASVLLGTLPQNDAASYVSGLLIGSDVGARSDISGRSVGLLAAGQLAELYYIALKCQAAEVELIDSTTAFALGIHAIWERLT